MIAIVIGLALLVLLILRISIGAMLTMAAVAVGVVGVAKVLKGSSKKAQGVLIVLLVSAALMAAGIALWDLSLASFLLA